MTITDSQAENESFPKARKNEIDWAQYLDYTLFIDPGEIKNEKLVKFRNDFSF